MNKKMKWAQYLIIISSIFFTIYASIGEKSDGVNDYAVYSLLYGAVLCPPIIFDIILKNINNMRQNEKFGLRLLRNVALVVILFIFILGEFSTDKVLLGPWLLLIIYSLCRLYMIP